MWLIVFMIIIIAAVIVCFSLEAAHKTGNFMHEQNKRRIENVKIKVYF